MGGRRAVPGSRLCSTVLLAVFGSLLATALSAQESRLYTTIVPFAAAGVAARIGPAVYGGLQLRRELSDALVGVLQAAKSASVAVCAQEYVSGRPQCGSNGTEVDIGVLVQARSRTSARPYLGIGAGTVRLGDYRAPAFHLNAGIALGARHGFSLMAEMRSQRIFGDIDAAAGRLSIGLGLGF